MFSLIYLYSRIFDSAKSKSPKSSKAEYQNYFDDSNLSFNRDYDVLGCWKENEIKFPVLNQQMFDLNVASQTKWSSEKNFKKPTASINSTPNYV